MPALGFAPLKNVAGRFVQQCEEEKCRRFTVTLKRARKDGILLENAWLCSAQCLENALVQTLTTNGKGREYAMPRLPRMPYRLLLLQDGVLSESGLKQAGQHAERIGVPLGRALLDLSLVTDAELAGALAAEAGCAFYALPPAPVTADAELPAFLAERCTAATVHSTPERLWIGFVHKVDHGLLRLMERMTGRKTEPCFITAAHHEQQLGCQAVPAGETTLLPDAASARAAAQAAVQHALRTRAEQVMVGRFGSMVWFRFHAGAGCHADRFVHLADEGSAAQTRSGIRHEKKLRVL